MPTTFPSQEVLLQCIQGIPSIAGIPKLEVTSQYKTQIKEAYLTPIQPTEVLRVLIKICADIDNAMERLNNLLYSSSNKTAKKRKQTQQLITQYNDKYQQIQQLINDLIETFSFPDNKEFMMIFRFIEEFGNQLKMPSQIEGFQRRCYEYLGKVIAQTIFNPNRITEQEFLNQFFEYAQDIFKPVTLINNPQQTIRLQPILLLEHLATKLNADGTTDEVKHRILTFIKLFIEPENNTQLEPKEIQKLLVDLEKCPWWHEILKPDRNEELNDLRVKITQLSDYYRGLAITETTHSTSTERTADGPSQSASQPPDTMQTTSPESTSPSPTAIAESTQLPAEKMDRRSSLSITAVTSQTLTARAAALMAIGSNELKSNPKAPPLVRFSDSTGRKSTQNKDSLHPAVQINNSMIDITDLQQRVQQRFKNLYQIITPAKNLEQPEFSLQVSGQDFVTVQAQEQSLAVSFSSPSTSALRAGIDIIEEVTLMSQANAQTSSTLLISGYENDLLSGLTLFAMLAATGKQVEFEGNALREQTDSNTGYFEVFKYLEQLAKTSTGREKLQNLIKDENSKLKELVAWAKQQQHLTTRA